MTEITCKNLFYSGQFTALIETYKTGQLVKPDLVFILAAYVFLGDLEKAEQMLKDKKLNNSTPALFFMSLGYVRSSQYEKAKTILTALYKKQKGSEDLFYIQQGFGFYRFFCGRYSKALLWAEKAQAESKTDYEKLINLDLLSHILIRLGKIQNGLKFSEKSLMIAKKLKNQSAADAIQVSTAVYQSQYGIDTAATFQNLLSIKNKFQNKNTYYFMNLTLESIRRLSLEGKIQQAEAELEIIKKPIFESSFDRQKSIWSFRRAHLHVLKRELQLANDMADAALEYIDQNIDLHLTVQILGLQYKILKIENSAQNKIDVLENRIKQITFLSQEATALSYAYRYGWIKKPVTEDPFAGFFHQWIRDGYKNYALIKKVAERKWVSLFVDLISNQNKNFIYLDVLPKQLMLFTANEIKLKAGLTPLIRQTLLFLSKGRYTKEQFVALIWGYQYDSYRHDPLVYTLINRIREVLGELGEAVVFQDNQIYLQSTEVRVYEHLQLPKAVDLTPNEALADPEKSLSRLNHRQLEILDYLKNNRFINVGQTSEILHISQITACRDLKGLVLEKMISRLGRGRATSYALR